MLGSALDSVLTRISARHTRQGSALLPTRQVATPVGPVRVFDSATARPCVVIVPDGPNLIEHYAALIALLTPHVRVVCFDMPGFGYSLPKAGYRHTLDEGASAVLGVLAQLGIARATLAFSCANGFYALRAAQLAPTRIASLVLSQTPSLAAMHAWTERVIPWPLGVPIVGQAAAWALRRKAAGGWYNMALPKATDRTPWQQTALQALADGACFCLAGVVQGLRGEKVDALAGSAVPCTMIWGSLDHSHRQTDPHSLLSCAPNAEIVRFEDCGHFPDIEQAARYADILLARVAQVN